MPPTPPRDIQPPMLRETAIRRGENPQNYLARLQQEREEQIRQLRERHSQNRRGGKTRRNRNTSRKNKKKKPTRKKKNHSKSHKKK